MRQKCAKLLSQRKAVEGINIKMKREVRVGIERGAQETLIGHVGGPMNAQIKKMQSDYKALMEEHKRVCSILEFQRTLAPLLAVLTCTDTCGRGEPQNRNPRAFERPGQSGSNGE